MKHQKAVAVTTRAGGPNQLTRPNQLEAETVRNDWYTARADFALVFDESRERLWDAAMERRLRDL